MAFLSTKTQEFVSSVLLHRPCLGCALLQALKAESGHPLQPRNRLLCAMHLQCLSSLLKRLRICQDQGTFRDTSEADSLHVEGTEDENLQQSFYELLALFNPTSEDCKTLPVKEFLSQLAESVLKGNDDQITKQPIFHRDHVYSSLLGQETTTLLEQYLECETKVIEDKYISQSKLDEDVKYSLFKSEKCLIGLSVDKDRPHAWRDYYLSAVKQERHFIDMIMVILEKAEQK